jgi:fatty-acyl-CoA synthase
LVVGVPDDRFGERIVAVLSAAPGSAVDKDELLAFARTKLAAYKLPRQLVVVEQVQRAANGKSDYKWAKEVALAGIG